MFFGSWENNVYVVRDREFVKRFRSISVRESVNFVFFLTLYSSEQAVIIARHRSSLLLSLEISIVAGKFNDKRRLKCPMTHISCDRTFLFSVFRSQSGLARFDGVFQWTFSLFFHFYQNICGYFTPRKHNNRVSEYFFSTLLWHPTLELLLCNFQRTHIFSLVLSVCLVKVFSHMHWHRRNRYKK